MQLQTSILSEISQLQEAKHNIFSDRWQLLQNTQRSFEWTGHIRISWLTVLASVYTPVVTWPRGLPTFYLLSVLISGKASLWIHSELAFYVCKYCWREGRDSIFRKRKSEGRVIVFLKLYGMHDTCSFYITRKLKIKTNYVLQLFGDYLRVWDITAQ